jgi:hypothetical protein
VIISVFLIGCTSGNEKPVKNNKVLGPDNEVTQRFLYKGYTKYAAILRNDAKLVGYLSEKHNSLADENLVVIDGQNRAPNKGAQKAKAAENFTFKINGIDLQDIKNQRQASAVRGIKAANSPLFGSNVTFTLSRKTAGESQENIDGIQRAPADADENVTMYIPELVHITSPRVETAEDLLPYCYYKDFTLKWNADPQNNNGLVVAVEWNGNDMFGKRYGQYVRNADIIPTDNGVAVLDDRLFDDIPQGAIANIILVRGNIEVLENLINEGDTASYRIAAASEAILPFIMVKEIVTIEE